MATALLIMIREGFEAALVVAIVFAYLRKLGRLDLSRLVWQGVAAAVAVSVAVGVIVHLSIGELQGVARQRAFAAISLAALIVLTWMVFWMRRQSRAIKGELEHKLHDALASDNTRRGIIAVAFLAVVREGIEAALFLLAAATADDGTKVLLGGLIGVVIACVLGLGVYAGGRSIPMKAFFKVTGMVLIVFAAGLLARTVLFLQMSGDLGTVNNAVYDLTRYPSLTQGTEVGRFLAAMFGWDPRPSFEQVVAWVAYIVPVSFLFLRTPRQASKPKTIDLEAEAGDPARTPVNA
jgi:high-affinity iron transporter